MQTPSGSQTLIGNNPQIQVRNNSSGVVKIFELTATEHYLGRETGRAEPIGLQVPADWVVLSRLQAVLRQIDGEWYIYDGDGVNPSSNRLFINNRTITPTEGHRLESGDAIEIGQDVQNSVQIIYIDPHRLGVPSAIQQKSVRITSDRPVILGRAEDADLVLSAPTVSRKHATISGDGKGKYTLRNLSSNPIFVDRQPIEDTATISSGSIVQIGPYTFVLQKDELILADSGDNIRLDVVGVTKVVKLKNNRSLCLLNDVSLAIEPGQLVAFVGGSGAGKSTLMRSLLGIERTSAGVVFLNGDNLTDNFNIYRNTIGYVPQMDIVHTNLTVREVLTYAAKLRLPADAEIDRVVDDTLRQIELAERQNTIVKNLSGGQLKRVSIGVELLADPKLFFLDEPTSGLDPGLDKKMMQLLRRLADRGCTVILVTHATSNITLCDRVAFMGLGGNLCYFGPPQQAIDFFNVPSGDFADIYINLETSDRVLDTANNFRSSEYYQKFVTERLSLPTNTKTPAPPKAISKPKKRSFWQQLILLIQRYIKLLSRDRAYLLLSLLTAPIGVALVNIATRTKVSTDPTVQDLYPFMMLPDIKLAGLTLKVLFVFTCAAIWIGLASSLQEITKEAEIYQRERLVNLRLFAYVGSKLLVLSALAILQTILMSAVILILFKQDIDTIFPWFLGLPITTFLTILATVCLGFMVSASVKNVSQANSTLPLLLLPQIIFAGVLFDLDKIAVGKFISWLTIGRWSVGAYGILTDLNGLIPNDDDKIGYKYSEVMAKSSSYDLNWQNLYLSWAMLLLHALVYLAITIWLQKRKDIVKKSKKTA